MWPLVPVLLWGCLLFPGCGALVGPKEISGFEGDTVSLQCTYREELRKHKKYWCKESGFFISRCSSTVYAGDDGQERTEGRVSLQDNPQELTLKVTLRKLTLQDAGKYFCGVSKLGRDESFRVSLLVLPGPCCPPSPTPSFRPLPTRSLQPQAKAWQTPLPELRTLRPSTQPEPASTEDTRLAPSRTSLSRVSIPMVRILAPVLVLLSLPLAAGLAALGSYLLRWRKEAQLATETQRNEKVHLSHLVRKAAGPNSDPCASLDYAVINLAGPPGPRASPEPSVNPCTEIQGPSQTSEEEEVYFQDQEGDMIPGPPLHMSGEEPGFSKFISV
ncbi:CMRF35-like molecule 9 isoform X6 [Herpailurus yagouaroundi]|uniref:CMRF35-like molecule 9 isoform X6 n=1 Tax=Herpailurus yagouaroundi TaxID=1608482 RepID=UPI001AD7972D|nr:CMRF35-like molecule 9 isoform X6 [Puma yagouaroundi]